MKYMKMKRGTEHNIMCTGTSQPSLTIPSSSLVEPDMSSNGAYFFLCWLLSPVELCAHLLQS